MAYPAVAILHDVDKCVRCRGCVVACKRRSSMTPQTTAQYSSLVSATSGDTVSEDELMVIKSQAYFDMGPMVRYSCWHCIRPSCIDACPISSHTDPASSAIKKLGSTSKAHGAVVVDYGNCQPDTVCSRECVAGCRGGGYPQIQDPSSTGYSTFYSAEKNMNKCDMCWERLEAGKTPLCVVTCPADAMKFDDYDRIRDYLNTQGYKSTTFSLGGQVIWASRQLYFKYPKADPYVEDHMSQVVDKLLRGPYARLALAPVGLAVGLYALQKRKEAQVQEAATG